VREDVENEFVSLESAKEIYRIVIEPDTLKVDHQATKALQLSKAPHGECGMAAGKNRCR
jgi:hypothetical protein